MNLTDQDLEKIDQLVERRLKPLTTALAKSDERLDRFETDTKTTGRRLDEISDKLVSFSERLDNVTDRLDELSDRTDKLQEDVTYIKQKQRQDHHEVMASLDDLKVQETEDIEAAYKDIEQLKKVIG